MLSLLCVKGGIEMRIDRIVFTTEIMKRDMNVKQFAKSVGIPQQTLYQIKCGQSCSETMGQKIADGLGVPLEQLKEKSTCY